MKTTILTALLVFSSTAFADDVVVKECSVTMKSLEGDSSVDMNMKVMMKDDKTLVARVSQTVSGATGAYNDIAEIKEQPVRAGLNVDSDFEDMNDAETLIVHAMTLGEDPVFQGAYSSGIELKNVRSAKLYTIGQKTNMGSSTIVEARDANNQVLGSFLGGFLVSPCK